MKLQPACSLRRCAESRVMLQAQELCPDPPSWPAGPALGFLILKAQRNEENEDRPGGYAFDDETGTWVCAPGYAGTAASGPENSPAIGPTQHHWTEAGQARQYSIHITLLTVLVASFEMRLWHSDSAVRAAAFQSQLCSVHSRGCWEWRGAFGSQSVVSDMSFTHSLMASPSVGKSKVLAEFTLHP